MNANQSGLSPANTLSTDGLKLFTLRRDNDRPVRFNGSAIALVESGSGVRHRAAVYQTRAGKFIAEFATAQLPPTSRPFSATPQSLKKLKDEFCDAIDCYVAASDIAREANPHNPRYENHCIALEQVGELLESLETTNAYWSELWALRTELGADQCMDIENEILGEFGFSETVDERSDWSAVQFLEFVTREIRERAPTKAFSGKISVFDTLPEALGFFKSGPLTNQLLEKLGRLEPEFIE